jgi:hypothetical protein
MLQPTASVGSRGLQARPSGTHLSHEVGMQEWEPNGAFCRPERENLTGTPSNIVGCLKVPQSLSSRKSVTFQRSN